MNIGENLRRLRRAAGLTQLELAQKSGVSQATISDLERGVNETTKSLPDLARALGASVADLAPQYGETPAKRETLYRTNVAGIDPAKLAAAVEGVLAAFSEVILDPPLGPTLARAVVGAILSPTPAPPLGTTMSEEDALRVSLQYMALAEIRERRLKASAEVKPVDRLDKE